MPPIVLPLDWRRYVDPRLLVDAKGTTRDHYPTALEIPIDLHLGFDPMGRINGFWCHYRKPFGESRRSYAVTTGTIAIYDDVGLLDRIELPGPADERTYESLEAPLRAFQLYAKNAKDRNRWPMIFSAEILNEYWKKEEDLLRQILTATAPYR